MRCTAHADARFVTRGIELHWAAVEASEVTKSADTCSNVGDGSGRWDSTFRVSNEEDDGILSRISARGFILRALDHTGLAWKHLRVLSPQKSAAA